MKPGELQWGLKRVPITEAQAAWGARAIYARGEVELLFDRQDLGADNEQLRARLVRKLNDGGGLRRFCAWAGDYKFDDRDDRVLEFVSRGVHFWASTLASYGYLYILAVLEDVHALQAPEVNETAAGS